MPTRRESGPQESAHDVLAADEFAVPAADSELRHDPVQLPEDPAGISEPHDVLAAEEFPMPAPRPHPETAIADRRGGLARLAVEVAVALVLVALVVRWRRRR